LSYVYQKFKHRNSEAIKKPFLRSSNIKEIIIKKNLLIVLETLQDYFKYSVIVSRTVVGV
jgi:hypothetical protein